jgi:hypothetical protein
MALAGDHGGRGVTYQRLVVRWKRSLCWLDGLGGKVLGGAGLRDVRWLGGVGDGVLGSKLKQGRSESRLGGAFRSCKGTQCLQGYPVSIVWLHVLQRASLCARDAAMLETCLVFTS